ncbi:MAG: hypothetical protein FWH29_10030 [Methanobrevibacter sp.]|nr:hypothetical protein [Methanobrevibacter sp.]
MNWKKIFKIYQLDYFALEKFQEKEGIKLFKDKTDFILTEKWCEEYKLGFNLLPLFTNNESDFVGVYTTGILKGKVACVNHDNIDFAPRFRNLKSFMAKINNSSIVFDWRELGLDSFDYPNKRELSQREKEEEDKILTECWNLIGKRNFISSCNYELIVGTILNLTYPTDLEKVLCFLDDENFFVQDKAIWIIGVFHQFLPAKEKVKKVAQKSNNRLLLEQCYNGEFKKENISIWKRIFS